MSLVNVTGHLQHYPIEWLNDLFDTQAVVKLNYAFINLTIL